MKKKIALWNSVGVDDWIIASNELIDNGGKY